MRSKLFLRGLKNQSCKMSLFDLLRHRKFQVDKLAARNTPHTARNRLYSYILWYIRGLESISILICDCSQVRYKLFENIHQTAFWNWSKVLFLSKMIFLKSRLNHWKLNRSNEGLTLETLIFFTLYGGQFTFSTQLLTLNYIEKNPVDLF